MVSHMANGFAYSVFEKIVFRNAENSKQFFFKKSTASILIQF
jgi:hypothetical protein